MPVYKRNSVNKQPTILHICKHIAWRHQLICYWFVVYYRKRYVYITIGKPNLKGCKGNKWMFLRTRELKTHWSP